ncbi:hypothetical protein J0871_06545 [Salegentibacter sp. BDJ18]|uniref:Ig-like domain-containing protein n=1 Tax=Salegentibacter sp. BDJ18 TaxID=2816376 RepID=UPI001AAF39D2|nr:hypothetical protein [Salegentibacter sp. BDJ18]MBO2544071.1 hypothetical protein [Salegentibacter sp. BDJ18]
MGNNQNLKLFTVVVLILLTFWGCSKEDDSPTPVEPTSPTVQDELVLHDNVTIIDSIANPLISTELQIEEGTYIFGGSDLDINEGGTIVGEQGNGFLRKVLTVKKESDNVTLTTEPASLDDLFKSGRLELHLDDESLVKSYEKSSKGAFSFENFELLSDSNLEVALINGSTSYDFDWSYDFNFDNGEKYMKFSSLGSYVESDFSLLVEAKQKLTLATQSKTLRAWYFKFRFRVPVVILGVPAVLPVNVLVKTSLDVEFGGHVEGALRRRLDVSTKGELDLGAQYINGDWDDLFIFEPNTTVKVMEKEGVVTSEANVAVMFKTTFLFYGLIGPNVDVGPQLDMKEKTSTEDNWHFRADAYIKSSIGIRGRILSKQLEDFQTSFRSDSVSFLTPFKVEKLSGDNQIGQVNKILSKPLKVLLLDSNGQPESDVPVYFEAQPGHGKALPDKVFTDENGIAETTWELGSTSDAIQYMKAIVKKGDGSPIENSPLEFAAAVGLKIEVKKGDKENIDENKEVEVELLVVDGENQPVKDALVRVSSNNPYISYTPTGPYRTDVNGLAKFKVKVNPGNFELVIPILAEIKNDDGELLADKSFEIYVNPLVGVWDWIGSTDLQPGEPYENTTYDCPFVPLSREIMHGMQLVFTMDRFSVYLDEEAVFYHIDLDENCNITEDEPDTVIERRTVEFHGSYVFQNGILTLTYDEGTNTDTYNENGSETEQSIIMVKFLNDSGTLMQFGDEEDEEEDLSVYKKRE